MIELRICSSQQRRVRRSRKRHVCVCVVKDHTLVRNGVEIRSEAALRSEKAHAIGTSRIEGGEDGRDESVVGTSGRCGGRRRSAGNVPKNQERRKPERKYEPPNHHRE